VPVTAYQRPQTEEQLLAALEEIDGGDGLSGLDLDFGSAPETTDGTPSTGRLGNERPCNRRVSPSA